VQVAQSSAIAGDTQVGETMVGLHLTDNDKIFSTLKMKEL
jgi:hypothetical protein